MSRSLGEMQRAILDLLGVFGGPMTTDNLASAMERGPDPEDWIRALPTRSQLVATRRAIHALERRGLLHAGRGYFGDVQGGPVELFAWLPDHEPPSILVDPIDGKVVETHVLAVLADGFPWDDDVAVFIEHPAGHEARQSEMEMPYGYFTRKVHKLVAGSRWSGWRLGREATAISRAVRRLVRAGKVVVRGAALTPSGISYRRALVRLADNSCPERTSYFKATHSDARSPTSCTGERS